MSWQNFDNRDYVILILTLFSKLKLYQKLTIFLFFLYTFQTNEVGVSTNRHCDMLHILILNWQVPESDLYCSQCKRSLPYCIATGYHITPTDLTMCPECKFPASRSELLKLVEDGVVCPMCVETLAASDIKVLTPSMLRTGNEEVEEKVEVSRLLILPDAVS